MAVLYRVAEDINMNQEFMKEKPVMPLVVSMALPMTISMLVNALYNIVDSYFVAKISEDAMTALSLVFPLQNLINAVTVGFGIGINAVIAFFMGAGRKEDANRAASTGLLCNIIHGVMLMAGCLSAAPHFLKMFTADENVLRLGIRYSGIVFLFSVPVSIGISFEKIFQAVGRMKVSMGCMIAGCIVNIILDPLFIFGFGNIRGMGISGAALATGIGQVVTMLLYIIVYFVRPLSVRVSVRYARPEAMLCGKIYSVGIPATLNLALPSIQVSALNGILAVYGGGYVFVLGVYYKLQTFLYLTANGVVQGMRPLLGYNYGAGEYKRVKDIFKSALIIILSVMLMGTILCLSIPDLLIGMFTDSFDTMLIGVNALRIISIGFVISSVSVTVSGALEGLSKGGQSLVISLLRYIFIMLPLALVLNRLVGAYGVWHAFWLTEFIMAAVSFFMYSQYFPKAKE